MSDVEQLHDSGRRDNQRMQDTFKLYIWTFNTDTESRVSIQRQHIHNITRKHHFKFIHHFSIPHEVQFIKTIVTEALRGKWEFPFSNLWKQIKVCCCNSQFSHQVNSHFPIMLSKHMTGALHTLCLLLRSLQKNTCKNEIKCISRFSPLASQDFQTFLLVQKVVC